MLASLLSAAAISGDAVAAAPRRRDRAGKRRHRFCREWDRDAGIVYFISMAGDL